MDKRFRLLAGVFACLLAFSTAGMAQEEEDLKAKLDEKLSKDFVKNANWVLDYDEALKQSKESGKLIFGYFTRSYAP